jgi:hypothetical protein
VSGRDERDAPEPSEEGGSTPDPEEAELQEENAGTSLDQPST